jgi:murein DD-endopeptidase MepM/ murein hydrolase activator NlpD
LTDKSLASAAVLRRGMIESLIGAASALVVITVAHASLPEPPSLALQPAPRLAMALAPVPAPPPVLIAFQPPLPDGHVGSAFGLRELPWEERARLHAGVDLVAPEREAVLAAADGVVTRVGQDPGYGRFVELKHAAGLSTRYGHLARFAEGVAPGVAVKAGTAVGQLGSTGASTGDHLHFEVRDAEDRPMNPELFLGHAFATAADLPLAAARRTPRQVHLAYVSRIPRAKQAEMDARLSAAASEAAGATELAEAAPQVARRTHGRLHVRLRL